MARQFRYQLWIALAAAVVFFTNLGVAGLWDEDEPLYASCAREMLQRGDWVVPYYNGEMFPDKPPLMFWTMMAGFKMFGINELGARFWSAVIGVATALLGYHLGRRLFNDEVGLWSGLITATTIIFTISARAATVDSALVFVTTLLMLLFAFGGIARRSRTATTDDTSRTDGTVAQPPTDLDYLPQSWLLWIAIWALAAVAILAKGPVGLLLPMASIGLFLMIMNYRRQADRYKALPAATTWLQKLWHASIVAGRVWHPTNFLRSLWQMRPLTGVVVVALVAAPWFVLVGMRNEFWLQEFFARFNLRPFTEPILGHSGPIWYHIPAILIGFFPWAIFLGPAGSDVVGHLRRNDRQQPAYILLCCWAGVFFMFWSVCSTKLPHYTLPIYPAMAILTAGFLCRWIADPTCVPRWWPWSAFITLVVIGLGILVGIPIAATYFLPGESWLGLFGLIPLVGGLWFMFYQTLAQRRKALLGYAVMSVAFLTALFGYATVRVDRFQTAQPVIADIRNDSASEKPPIVAFPFVRESTVFYAGDTVPVLDETQAMVEHLSHVEQAPYIITLSTREDEVHKAFPGRFRVLSRRPRFLHKGEVVVLAPADAGPSTKGPALDHSSAQTATRPGSSTRR